MTPNPDDTEHLIQRARDGDKTARTALLVRHERRLMAALERRGRTCVPDDPSLTRDIVQDSLIDAYCELDEYLKHPRRPFLEWLVLVARRRLESINASIAEDAPQRSPANPTITASWLARQLAQGSLGGNRRRDDPERAGRLDAALALLDAEHRELLVLRHVERLSLEEIARKLGRASGDVKLAYLRALDRLRDLLEEQDAGG